LALIIFVLCYCGLGSGLLMRMAVEALLKEKGLEGNVTVYGAIDMPATPEPDLVIATPEIAEGLKAKPSTAHLRMLVTQEYFDKEKIRPLLFPILDEIVKTKK